MVCVCVCERAAGIFLTRVRDQRFTPRASGWIRHRLGEFLLVDGFYPRGARVRIDNKGCRGEWIHHMHRLK